jgi:hypothetical protein
VNRVPGCAELVGERDEAECLSLCVVKQQQLGHPGIPNTPGKVQGAKVRRVDESYVTNRSLAPSERPVLRGTRPGLWHRRLGEWSGITPE